MPVMETSTLGILIAAVLGAVVLFYGRKLFWLFVGLVGFVLCFEWAPQWFPGLSEGATLIVSLVVGAVGAVLAVFLQYVLVALAGLVVGAIVGGNVGVLLGMPQGEWLAPACGALAGGILALLLLDWGLIVLSSLIGATVLTQALEESLGVGQDLGIAIGVGLGVLGIAVQAYQLGQGSRR